MTQKNPSLDLKVAPGDRVTVSVLSNAVYYFFQRVFILSYNGTFRLIAVHNGELLADEVYDTAKGAKIAFLKLYWYRAWQDDVKPQWTAFYAPDDEWLEGRFKLPESA